MRAQGERGLSTTQAAAITTERMRQEGKAAPLLNQRSRKREVEITRFRDFKTYARAKVKEKR